MTMTPDSCTAMLESARRVLAACDEDLVAAFVFGSVAWGDADAGSDLDLMLLLDRTDDFREVRRVRVSDLIGDWDSAPSFVDIDRISFARFRAEIERGRFVHRVVNSIVLVDDGRYLPIRTRLSAQLADPRTRAELTAKRVSAAHKQCAAAERLAGSDPSLAVLQARLAAEEAGAAVLQASGNRLSVAHFFDGLRPALHTVGRERLIDRLHTVLALRGGTAAAARTLQSYRVIAEALRGWMADPQTASRLGPEHVAWAEFTYSPETYEEFDHKIAALARGNREAETVLYVDGLLKVPLRINTSKALNVRIGRAPDRMSIPEFHAALRTEPGLYREWVAGLRLEADRHDVKDTIEVAHDLLASTDDVLTGTTVHFR